MTGPDTFTGTTLGHRWEWNHNPDTWAWRWPAVTATWPRCTPVGQPAFIDAARAGLGTWSAKRICRRIADAVYAAPAAEPGQGSGQPRLVPGASAGGPGVFLSFTPVTAL